jgi:hypothetical protein
MGVMAAWFFHKSSDSVSAPRYGQLIVEIPDERLKAHLRLTQADEFLYQPGVAIDDYGDQLPIVSGNLYQLKNGTYRLTVLSDDVAVFSDTIHVFQEAGGVPQTYEVKRGGVLNVEAQSDGTYMSVELNGHAIMDNVQHRSQRMLVVPEGTIRLKSYFGNHVYAERWLELKAGEEKQVRVSQQSIDELPANPAPMAARPGD